MIPSLPSATAADPSVIDLATQQQQRLDEIVLAQSAFLRHQDFGRPPVDQSMQFPPPCLSQQRGNSLESSGSSGASARAAKTVPTKAQKPIKVTKDKPKRPLSAYNLFFKDEREFLLNEIREEDKDGSSEDGDKKPSGTSKNSGRRKPHGKLGFEQMAKIIAKKWREIEPGHLEHYQRQAEMDKQRYKAEMEVWNQQQRNALTEQRDVLERFVDKKTKEAYFGKAEDRAPKRKKRDGDESSS